MISSSAYWILLPLLCLLLYTGVSTAAATTLTLATLTLLSLSLLDFINYNIVGTTITIKMEKNDDNKVLTGIQLKWFRVSFFG